MDATKLSQKHLTRKEVCISTCSHDYIHSSICLKKTHTHTQFRKTNSQLEKEIKIFIIFLHFYANCVEQLEQHFFFSFQDQQNCQPRTTLAFLHLVQIKNTNKNAPLGLLDQLDQIFHHEVLQITQRLHSKGIEKKKKALFINLNLNDHQGLQ